MDMKLSLLEDVSYLSSLATDAVVTIDDLTEKLQASQELENRVGVPRAELAAAETTLRKVLSRVYEVKSSVRAEILAREGGSCESSGAGLAAEALGAGEVAAVPGSSNEAAPAQAGQTLDGLWEAAYSAHPGPWEFESTLLPDAAPSAAERHVRFLGGN